MSALLPVQWRGHLASCNRGWGSWILLAAYPSLGTRLESYLRTFRVMSAVTTNCKDGGRTRPLRTNSDKMWALLLIPARQVIRAVVCLTVHVWLWSGLFHQLHPRPHWRNFQMRWILSWIGICLESNWIWKITNSVRLTMISMEMALSVASMRCWVTGFEMPNVPHGEQLLMPFVWWENMQLPRRYEKGIATPPLKLVRALFESYYLTVGSVCFKIKCFIINADKFKIRF